MKNSIISSLNAWSNSPVKASGLVFSLKDILNYGSSFSRRYDFIYSIPSSIKFGNLCIPGNFLYHISC